MTGLRRGVLLIALAVIGLQRQAAVAQTPPEAEAFVRHIYAQYQIKTPRNDGPDFLGRHASDVFSPELVRLIRLDVKNTPRGDVGKMDFDPICACQDFAGLQLKELRVVQNDNRTATVAVKLFFGPPSDSSVVDLRLRLIWLPQGWRIDDIETKDTPSLKKYLR